MKRLRRNSAALNPACTNCNSGTRPAQGFTKAGIRKLIARLHEEIAVFEGSEEARTADSKS